MKVRPCEPFYAEEGARMLPHYGHAPRLSVRPFFALNAVFTVSDVAPFNRLLRGVECKRPAVANSSTAERTIW